MKRRQRRQQEPCRRHGKRAGRRSQTTSAQDHIVNFHERGIPPKHRGSVTFQTLHNLACERNRLDNDFNLMVDHGVSNYSTPDLQRAYEQDYIQRDQQYNLVLLQTISAQTTNQHRVQIGSSSPENRRLDAWVTTIPTNPEYLDPPN
jgi:hypothetical protein